MTETFHLEGIQSTSQLISPPQSLPELSFTKLSKPLPCICHDCRPDQGGELWIKYSLIYAIPNFHKVRAPAYLTPFPTHKRKGEPGNSLIAQSPNYQEKQASTRRKTAS